MDAFQEKHFFSIQRKMVYGGFKRLKFGCLIKAVNISRNRNVILV